MPVHTARWAKRTQISTDGHSQTQPNAQMYTQGHTQGRHNTGLTQTLNQRERTQPDMQGQTGKWGHSTTRTKREKHCSRIRGGGQGVPGGQGQEHRFSDSGSSGGDTENHWLGTPQIAAKSLCLCLYSSPGKNKSRVQLAWALGQAPSALFHGEKIDALIGRCLSTGLGWGWA